ncbi:MAG: hypothetical protein LAO76_11680 [Acidobacteriia bacterium]|nr:hypothetical protein [Terriglobia bacterium]
MLTSKPSAPPNNGGPAVGTNVLFTWQTKNNTGNVTAPNVTFEVTLPSSFNLVAGSLSTRHGWLLHQRSDSGLHHGNAARWPNHDRDVQHPGNPCLIVHPPAPRQLLNFRVLSTIGTIAERHYSCGSPFRSPCKTMDISLIDGQVFAKRP